MSRPTLDVLHLYPRDMNIYGDWGNVLTIKRRLEWRGYDAHLMSYDPGDPFPAGADIVIGGGGQDSGQDRVHEDLLGISDRLREMAADGVAMLMVCGMFQLFGRSFVTSQERVLEGIGLFDMQTRAGPQRLIGNIVLSSERFGTVVGYENHSGRTVLGPGVRPLGTVVKGAGNNGDDGAEGAMAHNVIGTYLHGPLLPKNPAVADFLIERAAVRRYGHLEGTPPDDSLAALAREVATARPR